MTINNIQRYTTDKRVSMEDELWIDCDKSQLEDLTKHMKKYILRKKVEIEDISDEIKIWSLMVTRKKFFYLFQEYLLDS